jgi:hypothetical protein
VRGLHLARAGRRELRRGIPIMAYVGPNGGGKTAAAVWDSMTTLAQGLPVLSTVRLLDFDNPRPCDDPTCDHPEHDPAQVAVHGDAAITHRAAHPGWIPFKTWEQLLEFQGGDAVLDEVTGVASSRESHSMPAPVANALVQMRRKDVVIRWTAPSWTRADKIIRECSQGVTHCLGFAPKDVRAAEGRRWRQRRLLRWRTYDASLFDEFTEGKRQQLRPMGTDWAWSPRSRLFDAYDTYDSVLTIGTVSEGGTCYRCGGRRSRPACSCPPATHADPAAGPPRSGVQPGRRRREPQTADA